MKVSRNLFAVWQKMCNGSGGKNLAAGSVQSFFQRLLEVGERNWYALELAHLSGGGVTVPQKGYWWYAWSRAFPESGRQRKKPLRIKGRVGNRWEEHFPQGTAGEMRALLEQWAWMIWGVDDKLNADASPFKKYCIGSGLLPSPFIFSQSQPGLVTHWPSANPVKCWVPSDSWWHHWVLRMLWCPGFSHSS